MPDDASAPLDPPHRETLDAYRARLYAGQPED